MRDETVARSYAATLFELARRHDGLEAFGSGIGMVAHLLDEDAKFRLFLETPRISAAAKKDVVRRVFGDVLPRPLLNFVLVVIDKRRQRILRTIARLFNELVDEHENRVHVDVTVARPIDENTTREIAERLGSLLGKTAIPHVRVNPGILGGVVVRTGDTVFDGSLRRRLAGLRRQLLTASSTGEVG